MNVLSRVLRIYKIECTEERGYAAVEKGVRINVFFCAEYLYTKIYDIEINCSTREEESCVFFLF